MAGGWRPETPYLTVDIIIELVDRPGRPVVFIERKNPPYGFAWPGGFVDRGERTERAAVREAMEETALQVKLKALLGVYSDPERDPRWPSAGLVYVAEATGEPRAEDDAKALRVALPEDAPPLVFDHALILADYLCFRDQGALAPLREG